MATPTSSTGGYATAADALAYFDARAIGDLVSDSGGRVPPAALVDDTTLAALLLAASGEVEAACIRGHRYDPADLAALTGSSAAFLKQLVCSLAVGRALLTRRNVAGIPADTLKWAEGHLIRLRDGEEIFGLVESQAAGVEDLVTRQPGDNTNGRPRIVERADRYFGGCGRRGW